MFAVSRTNIIKELRKRAKLLGLSAQYIAQDVTDSSRRELTSPGPRATGDSHHHLSEGAAAVSPKPPNILVHHGDSANQCRLRQLVTSIVGSVHYTVYDLPLAAPPVWLDSAALLVVAGQLSGPVTADVERFTRGGGAVLSLSSSLTLDVLAQDPEPAPDRSVLVSYGEERDVPCQYSATVRPLTAAAARSDDVTTPVTVRVEGGGPEPPPPPVLLRCCSGGGSGGTVLLSQLHWDAAAPAQLRLLRALLRTELDIHCAAAAEPEVQYRPGFLVADAATAARLAVDVPARHTPALRVVSTAEEVAATEDLLPLLVSPPPVEQFDATLYRRELETRQLGRCLLYLPVVTSSMDVLRDGRLPHGAVVVCHLQTRGRGRAGNVWLSPAGCCMLSALLLVELNSPLGGRLSWLQHAAALAVVEAVGDPRLGLKWPNDLYWAGHTKVGGVLVETAVTGTRAECRLGVGVNLDNAAPTVCLNRLLAAPVARERLVARLLTRLERLLELEAAELSRRYRRHWLHQEQPVTVHRDGVEVTAHVCGLDPHGFLLVRADADGAELAVSPDGNSFDMMRGLIVPKQPA